MAKIEVQALHKSFGDFVAVKDSNFTVEDGEFFCLLGPSGCGKTTTLRMIAGLELPTSGSILLAGDDVTLRRASARDIAFVFQLFALYPHMNVRRNIAFPLVSMGVRRAEVNTRVEEAARILRITELLDRPVSGLSGGDRQRVALGRAIVRRPKAFLMDEPLGALDAELRQAMTEELHDLHDRIGATTVYVTHDQIEAMSLGDKIAVMNQGVVEQIGAPQEIYDLPATMFVADFVGSPPMNFIRFEGRLKPHDRSVKVGAVSVAIPEIRQEGSAESLVLGVRPECVSFLDSAPFRGRVFGTEYLGTTQIVTVDIEQGQIKARLPSLLPVRAGETVGLAFKPDSLMVFDRETGRAIRSALHQGERHG
ncbi:MAG TPA: ABC transporter ATP-binding protein [Roseiarcus sp.]|jgi:multiple sugar transport system ATP-binding protein